MAYKSKYYDPVKAHEYYEKHKKLKGRKKSTSIADLSEEGKIAAKEVKEQLNAELKAALKKVKKGNTAERKRLRELYAAKYEAELEQIRKDPAMLKAPKQKKEKAPKQAKAKAAKEPKAAKSSAKTTATAASKTQTKTQEKAEEPVTESAKILDAVNKLKKNLILMNDEQKAEAKALIEKLVEQYKKKLLAEKGIE